MTLPIKHILVAEDDEDDIFMFQSAAKESCPGLEMTIARDGSVLIGMLKDLPAPDAIFLDLNMPRKNGRECLDEIRKTALFDNVPVIILSTSNNKKDIEYCLQNGANHYIIKPASYDALKHIVEDLCNGRLTACK